VRIGLAQINPTIGDFTGNCGKVVEFSAKALSAGCRLVVFPELCLCGYPPMDLLEYGSFVEEELEALRRLRSSAPRGIGILLGYVDRNRSRAGKGLLNAASLIVDGEITHSQAKTLLPTYDVFDEARWFEPAPERRPMPFDGERIGVAICEDLWWESEPTPGLRYPIDPVAEQLNAGATLIVCPSASPFDSGKMRIRHSLLSRIGKSSGVPAVYVNTVGANDSLIFDGRSMATASDGTLAFLGEGFREQLGIFDTEAHGPEVRIPQDPYPEIERALVLGIRDYTAKCGFSRVHLGLSGGIDSALVAVLAVEALGPERVTAFALPSRYSSAASLDDAELRVLSIEGIFGSFLDTLAPLFEGRKPDVTEENVQARIRGALLMAYSNKFGSMLLTTGNKSELATGYATLYGDMCGGLAVIADLLKTEVYALARSINSRARVIPEAIITKAPTAELRPNQRDQDSLPPYETLDGILEAFLIHNGSAEEISRRGFDPGLVRSVIGMVEKAEYKRRQAPPALKISPKAFGMGRRIPIARKS
jgi:NAD+ synthase (glutamine-hydrolysing)